MAQWSSYLTKLCTTWTTHLEEKTTAMTAFEEAENKWMSQLHEATSALARVAGAKAQQSDSISVADSATQKNAREAMQKQEQQITNTLAAAEQSAKLQAAAEASRVDRERSPRRRKHELQGGCSGRATWEQRPRRHYSQRGGEAAPSTRMCGA